MRADFQYAVFFALIVLFSIALTELVRIISQKVGFVSRPGGEQRWSQRTVSLGGGVAINLAILVGILWIGDRSILLGILPAVLLVFGMGLVDDIRGVPPSMKLLVQTIAATFVVSQGYVFPIAGWPVLGIALTTIWIVGVSNAVNLIDNMDGLAAGVAVIAGLGLAALVAIGGNMPSVALALALAGSCAGFLVHNFAPARIFMGDAGSLVIGFLLAVLSTQLRFLNGISQSLTFVPACILLLVPLFDTTLVTVSRRNAKRPISMGGRDHTSHRLVWLGLSERRAVVLLYLMGGLGVVLSAILFRTNFTGFITATFTALVLLTLFGIFLLELAVYPALPPETAAARRHPVQGLVQGHNSLPMPVLFVVEMAVDIGMVCLAWTTAHLIRFQEGQLEVYQTLAVVPMLPQLIATKLIAFFIFRLYRGMWRSILAQDVYRIFKAATLGTLLFIAVSALTTRLQDISRIVIVLDWLFTFLGLLGTRAAITAFHRWSRYLSATPQRAALLGSSALLEFLKEDGLGNEAITFYGIIATDENATVGGGVLGTASDVARIVKENGIDVLYVTGSRYDATLAHLASSGVMIRPVRLQLM